MKSPTEEQRAVIDCSGNIAISARPGSGKTYTLALKIAEVSKTLLSYQGIAALSYTNKASDELRDRCIRFGAVEAMSYYGTISSFCVAEIISKFVSHAMGRKVDISIIEKEDCVTEAQRTLCRPWADGDQERWDYAVDAIESGGIPLPSITEIAFYLLERVPELRAYMRSRYTHIFIDEYQDCGYSQHRLFLELMGLGLTGVVVGDLDQAIYAYDNKSDVYFKSLLAEAGFSNYNLTKNHRCHSSIVNYSLRLIGVDLAPLDGEKRVFSVAIDGDEIAIAKGIEQYLLPIMDKYNVESANQIAILCRSNDTIKRYSRILNVPTKICQSTKLEVGYSSWRRLFRQLIEYLYSGGVYPGDFVDKYISDSVFPLERLRAFDALEVLLDAKDTEWRRYVGKFTDIAMLCDPEHDSAADVALLSEVLEDVRSLRAAYQPAKPEEINLLTYHKSKGLEYDVVFCLECYKYLMPLEKNGVILAADYNQSMNTHYVGITRARKASYILLGSHRYNAKGVRNRAIPSVLLSEGSLSNYRRNVKWEVAYDPCYIP